MRADRPQSFHIEGVMFQIRNVNGAMPFPEDRGWKDTVWVDGQVELLVYYAQPSAALPVPSSVRRWSLPIVARSAQLLVNPRAVIFILAGGGRVWKILLHFHYHSGL